MGAGVRPGCTRRRLPGKPAGRAVPLMPHREKGMDEKALPGEYRRLPT